MGATSECLTREQLRGLLDGVAAGGAAEHVENCPACQEALERLTDPDAPGSTDGTAGLTGAEPDEAFLSRLARECIETPERPAPAADAPPARVAGYRVVRLLGRGGMGAVYEAEQDQPRRAVALKVIRPGMASPDLVRRFAREGDVLGRLHHPGIAQIYAAGVGDDGQPYFAMELVGGAPITRFCDDRRLSVRERLGLFVRVCEAVQHAHQRGVIHRDIKPSNVLVAEVDGRPAPKVIDFGIAKAAGPAPAEATLLTGYGAVVGTPAYMAPEQAEPDQLDIDTRADVYALGVLLYELLTGGTPLDLERLRRAGVAEVLRLVREEEPPRPSTRLGAADTLPALAAARGTEPRRLAALVRGELDWVVMKALEKDRGRRYESAGALARDVQRHLAGEPVEAAPPSAGYRLRKFLRRHRGPALAAALVLAAVLAGAGVSVWQAVRATAAEARALEREQATKTALETAQAVAAFMREVFAQAGAEGQASPTRAVKQNLTVREAMDYAAREVGGRMAGRPEVEAAVRDAVGRTYRELGAYREAAGQLERALAIRRSALGDGHPDTLATVSELGIVYWFTQRPKEAEALFTEALAGLRAAYGDDHLEPLKVTHNLGVLYASQGRYAEAERMYERALAGRRRALGDDAPDTLATLANLGNVRRYQGRAAEAEELFREAVAGRRRTLGPDHPQTLASVTNLGTLYLGLGRYADAEPLLREAYDGYRRIRQDPHPEILGSTGNLGELYVYMGRHAEAEPLIREALAGSRKLYGPAHRETLRLTSSLGNLYVEMGRYAEAEPLLVAALAGRRKIFPDPGHRDVLASVEALGRLRQHQKKYAEAEELFREAVRGYERQPGQAVKLATVRASLGEALLRRGDAAAARAALTAAYEVLQGRAATLAPWQRDGLRAAIDGLTEASERLGDTAAAARWREEQAKLPPAPTPLPSPAK